MRAGMLTDIVKIYHPTVSRNAAGEEVTEFVQTLEIKAAVQRTPRDRSVENNEMVFPSEKVFVARIYQQIAENDRVEHEGKMYRVLSIDADKKLRQITIKTELIQD